MRIESFRTPNFLIGRDGEVPRAIVVHTNVGSLRSTVAWFGSTESGVSAHYVVGLDGNVGQFVDETDTARHAGRVKHAYSARSPQNPLHAQVEAAGRSLGRYVAEAAAAPYFNNGQTRLLGATDPRTSSPANADTLVRAKRHLERHFSVAGVTERFDDSLRLMIDAFGWSPATYRREKVSPNRPERVTDEEARIIVERNRLDTELHAFAAERMAARAHRSARDRG